MKADKKCFFCCRKKAVELLDQYQVSGETRDDAIKKVEKILKEAEDKKDMTAPDLMADIMPLLEKSIGVEDIYKKQKEQYNRLLLDREEMIKNKINEEDDHFLAGIQCAVTGNYIDFSAISDVNEDKLNELLENRAAIRLDERELENLKRELKDAKKLAYITDNAGEIVLDKIFISELKKLYPELEVAVIVRGYPIINDATPEDAEFVGMGQVARIISSGSNIPGTQLEKLSEEAVSWIEDADLCIAKGQANFETLRGSGKNIYYLFLCKCELFVEKFHVEQFSPILSNELRIVQYA